MHEPNSDESSLQGWMVEYQQGSLAAFERLYAALVSPVSAFLRSTQRRHSAVADLVQETFLELHRSRHTYEPGRPVRAWVQGIAHNVSLRYRRQEHRRTRHEAEWLSEPGVAEAQGTSAGVDLQKLDQLLQKLSPALRSTWLLHHVYGVDFERIGKRLGIASPAARLRASRATRFLRQALGLEDGDD